MTDEAAPSNILPFPRRPQLGLARWAGPRPGSLVRRVRRFRLFGQRWLLLGEHPPGLLRHVPDVR